MGTSGGTIQRNILSKQQTLSLSLALGGACIVICGIAITYIIVNRRLLAEYEQGVERYESDDEKTHKRWPF